MGLSGQPSRAREPGLFAHGALHRVVGVVLSPGAVRQFDVLVPAGRVRGVHVLRHVLLLHRRVVSRQERAAVPALGSRRPGLRLGHGRLGPRNGHRHQRERDRRIDGQARLRNRGEMGVLWIRDLSDSPHQLDLDAGVRRIPQGASRQASVLPDRSAVVRRLQHRVQRGAAAGVQRLRVLRAWATIRWDSCWASPRLRS